MKFSIILFSRPALFAALAFFLLQAVSSTSTPINIIEVVNESGRDLQIFRIHSNSKELQETNAQRPIPSGYTFPLELSDDASSLDTVFLLQILLLADDADDDATRINSSGSYTVDLEYRITSEDSLVKRKVTVTDEWKLRVDDMDTDDTDDSVDESHIRAKKIVEECQQEELQQASFSLQECVQQRLAAAIKITRDDISVFDQIRKRQGAEWEEYACDDNDLETSPALEERLWYHPLVEDSPTDDRNTYSVQILHDHKSSQIHLVEAFIDPLECAAVLSASADDLHQAKVHDGKGGDKLSDHRKAMQAGIEVDWDQEEIFDSIEDELGLSSDWNDYDDNDSDDNDRIDSILRNNDTITDHLIARLSRRVYDYTNHVMDLDIGHHGQESLMSIQYFGNPLVDNGPPDRYAPHCDGECTGRPHKRGTRMATMVMYCEVPEVGGHTNFRNAGVHIKPKAGSALFFSYMDPETGLKDDGFTSHSGCPVYDGSKKIVTQWVRLGVDDENPAHSFNTLGIQEEEEEEEEEDEAYAEHDEVDDYDDDDENGDIQIHTKPRRRRILAQTKSALVKGLQRVRKLRFKREVPKGDGR